MENMLDPRLLRSFAAIVDAGSFTLAAERLNMTQSTISQQLARLEQAVGVALVGNDGGSLWARGFGFIALIFASVNIFGGFLVTQRMLAMYKKKQK